MLTFWQKNKRRLICLISSSSSAHAQKKQCSGISVVDQRNGGTSEKQGTVVYLRRSSGVTALTKSGLTTPYLKDKRNYYGIDECWRYFIMNESKIKKLSMFQRREIGVFPACRYKVDE